MDMEFKVQNMLYKSMEEKQILLMIKIYFF